MASNAKIYNQDVKLSYCKSLESDAKRRNAQRIFDILFECESKHDTDIYDIPFDILLPEVIKKSNISSFMTFRTRYYDIKDYKRWALNQGLLQPYAKAYVEENVDLKKIFLQCSNIEIFYTPQEFTIKLRSRLTKRVEYSDELSIDEIATAYAMLIYQGFSPNEAISLTVDNVKITEQNIAIITNDRIVIVYDEFSDLIAKVATCRNYCYQHANMQEVLPLNQYLIDNGRNAPGEIRRQNMMVIYNMRGLRLKLKDIYYMGKLYDFYQHHSANSDRAHILEYCFNGDRLTKTKREQFYRFIELWNS